MAMIEKIAEGIWRIRFGTPESITPFSLCKVNIAFEALAEMDIIEHPPFTEKDFSFEVTSRGCVLQHKLNYREKIYGFGLQLKSHNQRGLKKHLRVNSDPVADTGDSHAPVPFYVSTSGYGIYVDTARYATFNVGTHSWRRKSDENNSQKGIGEAYWVSEKEAIKAGQKEENDPFEVFKRKNTMVIEIPATQGIDIYIFAGPTMKNAVQRYNLFSGGGCLPPYWGLGVWYRTYAFANTESVREQTRGFRDAGIPVDVFGFEPTWHSHCYSCSYTWDKEKFQDPDGMIEELRNNNYKVNLWEHAYVHPTAPFYEEMKPYSGDTEVWRGLIPDFSLPQTRSVFSDYHKKEFVEKGISGFKLDECDNSDLRPAPWGFPNYTKFPSGMDGEQMHSMFGILYQHTLYSLYKEMNKRTLNQVRSSYALASSMPFILYSDLYDHRDYIRGIVNMGFSGLLWSPEIRQCESGEDLIRRIQSNIFSPHALVNAFQIINPPWFHYDYEKNNAGIKMENQKDIEASVRKLFCLRMSFIPYMYSLFAMYHFKGIPPIRALVMDYPDDDSVYDIDNEFILGDSILVAPMLAEEMSRDVYLPEGNWYCFWTGKKYEGLKKYSIELKLEQIPLFVKEDTLLPIAEPVSFITPETVFDITVHAYGKQYSSFTLYEDDGETFDYEKGMYNLINLKWDSNHGGKAEKSGNYNGNKYRISNWINTY